MRIAQLAPPFERVPPARYGGTERVVSVLTDELVRRGHDVTLFASADSISLARLHPIIDIPYWRHPNRYRDHTPFIALTLGRLAAEADSFDIIHSHLDYHAFPLARTLRCPVVTTLHGRLDLPELGPIFQEYTDAPVVAISESQRAQVPYANWAGTVHHGLALEQFRFQPEPKGYLAFLGRIAPEKGLDTAIRIARRAGMPLLIAAREPLANTGDPSVKADWEYYEQIVKPLLRNPGIEFIGEVTDAEKSAFLGDAAALLFPVRWPEPFGLVMVEALACGTPVLALRNGSVPEVIEHGVTGFVGDTEEELVEAIASLSLFDRTTCRRVAETRFSASAMAQRYEAIYESLLGASSPASVIPATSDTGRTAALAPPGGRPPPPPGPAGTTMPPGRGACAPRPCTEDRPLRRESGPLL